MIAAQMLQHCSGFYFWDVHWTAVSRLCIHDIWVLFKRACYLSQTLAEDIYSVIFYERVVYVVAEELTADLLVFLI